MKRACIRERESFIGCCYFPVGHIDSTWSAGYMFFDFWEDSFIIVAVDCHIAVLRGYYHLRLGAPELWEIIWVHPYGRWTLYLKLNNRRYHQEWMRVNIIHGSIETFAIKLLIETQISWETIHWIIDVTLCCSIDAPVAWCFATPALF